MSTPDGSEGQLRKTIGLYGAVALALGIVIGAGMLSLPGLVYREAGGWSPLAWLFDGLLVLPLLFVFAVLGRRFPTAGGVAGFVGQAFPKLRMGCSYLLVGTFALGIPAIALTGAGYLATFVAPAEGERALGTLLAFAFLAAVLAMAWFGARFAGVVQNAIVTLLVGGLACIVVGSIPLWERIDFTVGDPTWLGVWRGMGLAFFAYTGWEMLAFTAEEFKNPKRDFPLAVGVSFALVLFLYVGVALAVAAAVPPDSPLSVAAPLLAAVGANGGPAAAILVLAVAAIIVTNLNGACWAASRLFFDIGRSGWAPRQLGLERLRGQAATPRAAILALSVLLIGVLAGYRAGLWDLADLLRLAGQNFFLLYTLAVLAYVRLAGTPMQKAFGVLTLAVCTAFAGVFGWGLLYAALVFGLPYAALWARDRRIAASAASRVVSLY